MLGYMDTISQYYNQTMPQFFSEMGHQTIVVGKNHFGPPRNSNGYLTSKLEEGCYSSRIDGFDCDYQSWFEREAPDKDKKDPDELVNIVKLESSKEIYQNLHEGLVKDLTERAQTGGEW